jgi:hypothetical protein
MQRVGSHQRSAARPRYPRLVPSRNTAAALAFAAVLAAGAHGVGSHANTIRGHWPPTLDPPWAPAPASARIVSLGYREALADLLWVRALGYVGGDDDRASSTRQLVESIVALDPRFQRIYAWGGLAMSAIGTGAAEADYLAAIAVLERGAREFPNDFRIPLYAGEIYVTNLHTDDPDKARAWQTAGARWLERAVRVPGAPKTVATLAAHLRTKLGQREQAIRDLRELILYTNDREQRDRLVKKMAQLQGSSSDAIDYELTVAARRFQEAWDRDRPELPPTMYLLVGPPLPSFFEPADLAVDRDLIGTDEPIEPLDPVPD